MLQNMFLPVKTGLWQLLPVLALCQDINDLSIAYGAAPTVPSSSSHCTDSFSIHNPALLLKSPWSHFSQLTLTLSRAHLLLFGDPHALC